MVSENSNTTRSDASSGNSQTRFDWNGFFQPSTAVAEAVATATGREPTELEPIHESIDTDALDKIVTPTDTEGDAPVNVSFMYEGVEVLVDSQRGIEIRQFTEDDDV